MRQRRGGSLVIGATGLTQLRRDAGVRGRGESLRPSGSRAVRSCVLLLIRLTQRHVRMGAMGALDHAQGTDLSLPGANVEFFGKRARKMFL